MMDKFNTPRWKSFLSVLEQKTRFTQKDVEIVEDERKDCPTVIEQEQTVHAERRRSHGYGKSGAHLVADELQLDLLAEQERKRLQHALPGLAEKWLASSTREAQKMPAEGELDRDVKAFGMDSACQHCGQQGYLPCTACECTGKNKCPDCKGIKKTQCSFCGGRKSSQCTSCYGNTTISCSLCGGMGTGKCYGGCQNGTVGCSSCSGRGCITQTTVVDYGKGPATVTKDITCSECLGAGRTKCRSCNGVTPSCTQCHGSKKLACDTCLATGQIRCRYCDELGLVDCSTCSASGLVKCRTCDGHQKIVCRPCQATGWTHVKENIFTRLLTRQYIEHAKETPADWRKPIESAIGHANASATGSFSLSAQTLRQGPEVCMARTWHGSVPGWQMQARANDAVTSMFAIGNQEALIGVDAAVHGLLEADRTRIIDAARNGGKGTQQALQNYLTAQEHANAVLLLQKNPQSTSDTGVSSAFEIIQSHASNMERQATVAAWILYAATPIPLLLLLLAGTRFHYDWIATLAWPMLVACLHMVLQQAIIPRRLAQFTGHPEFTKSWIHQAHAQKNAGDAPRQRGLIKYIASACAALILLLSPGQPHWLAQSLSEVHLWRAQRSSPQEREQAYANELDAWLRCDARREEKLLATLKGMEKDGMAKPLDTSADKWTEKIHTWSVDKLKLLNYPVRNIIYFERNSHGSQGKTKASLEIYLDAGAADLKTITNRLQPEAQSLKTPYGVIKEIQELKTEDYSWHAQFKKESVYQGKKIPQGSSKKWTPKPSDFKEIPTIIVGCSVIQNEWLRIKY